MEHNYHMYYDNPAKRWGNALPLGNGRLGAMVCGETDMERITLNDDSLWYGLAAKTTGNPQINSGWENA